MPPLISITRYLRFMAQTKKSTTPTKGDVKTANDDYVDNIPTHKVLMRANGMWRRKKFINKVDHREIVQLVKQDGGMSSRYAFMVIMSCAIAMLGLLLSSPAVIIGAMLISPLMGPIMSLGFSLCILDAKQMRKSLEAIVIGIILSLAISYFIVFISPITDPTPEIMARTRPNLFDLLVAIFSGFAGGYATIKQKGATIVGVAIATALMPPLAVVGYGLATQTWAIAQGAFFLFMTNLLAISLTVTILAKWYGFGAHNGAKHTAWQAVLIVGVFAVLSLPLGLSLMDIAYQSYATKTTKAEINAYFKFANARVSNFNIAFNKAGDVVVDSLVVTDKYASTAAADIKEKLESLLDKPVILTLDQIVLAKEQQEKIEAKAIIPDTAFNNAVHAKTTSLTLQDDMVSAVKNAVFFPLHHVGADADARTVSIYPKRDASVNLSGLRRLEDKLSARFPDWDVNVIPPMQALPYVYFDIGSDNITDTERTKIDNITWTLLRWDIDNVAVIGYASTVGEYQSFNNTSLAYRRAKFVGDILNTRDVQTDLRAEYTSFAQKQTERDFGIKHFQRVDIRVSAPLEPLETVQPIGDPAL